MPEASDFKDLRVSVEAGEFPGQLVHVGGLGGVQQLVECRHVVGHRRHDGHVVFAGADELLHPGVDLLGDPKLLAGQGHAVSPLGGRSGWDHAESAPASMIARSYQRGRYGSYAACVLARRGWCTTHSRNACQAGEVKK